MEMYAQYLIEKRSQARTPAGVTHRRWVGSSPHQSFALARGPSPLESWAANTLGPPVTFP